jgi:L,D-peptidoglycan transpeptidase YkuD (ErfK/YbiS/YcfS/YnhG family)
VARIAGYVLLAGALLAVVARPGATASGARSCATVTPATRAAEQLVTVAAPDTRSTRATLRLWRRDGDCWLPAGGPWPARIGASGLSSHHREGDGTTPAGAFGLGRVMYGVAANPGVHYRYHRLVCGDWWDEDPASPGYNAFRHVACGTRPGFGGGSEALWRATRAYRHFAVIEYNVDPAVPGRGSAIFLHADTGAATNGCVSLALPALVRTLRWLRPASSPLILIGMRRRLGSFEGR